MTSLSDIYIYIYITVQIRHARLRSEIGNLRNMLFAGSVLITNTILANLAMLTGHQMGSVSS